MRSGRGAGFSLVELVVAVTVVAISAVAITTSVATSTSLNRANRETEIATRAARDAIERLRAAPFGQVFARYDQDPDNDPFGPGTAPGPGFDVPGLNVLPGDPDGMVGEILFPDGGNGLREDVLDRDLGMPRDLNGDGVVDDLDHSEDYRILPVRVRLRWTGASGRRELVLVTTL